MMAKRHFSMPCTRHLLRSVMWPDIYSCVLSTHASVSMQLSVLRVFQAILSDKSFRKQEGAGEVINMATHVTRNLCARLVPDNPYEGSCRL